MYVPQEILRSTELLHLFLFRINTDCDNVSLSEKYLKIGIICIKKR